MTHTNHPTDTPDDRPPPPVPPPGGAGPGPALAPSPYNNGILTFVIFAANAIFYRFYGVRVGRWIGIFLSWSEAAASVSGFSGAIHQRFGTFEEAAAFVWGPAWDLLGPWYVNLGPQGRVRNHALALLQDARNSGIDPAFLPPPPLVVTGPNYTPYTPPDNPLPRHTPHPAAHSPAPPPTADPGIHPHPVHYAPGPFPPHPADTTPGPTPAPRTGTPTPSPAPRTAPRTATPGPTATPTPGPTAAPATPTPGPPPTSSLPPDAAAFQADIFEASIDTKQKLAEHWATALSEAANAVSGDAAPWARRSSDEYRAFLAAPLGPRRPPATCVDENDLESEVEFIAASLASAQLSSESSFNPAGYFRSLDASALEGLAIYRSSDGLVGAVIDELDNQGWDDAAVYLIAAVLRNSDNVVAFKCQLVRAGMDAQAARALWFLIQSSAASGSSLK